MAQRARHEMNIKAERAAGKLLDHKVVLVAILIAVAVACGMGFSAVSGSGASGGVEIERGGAKDSKKDAASESDGSSSRTSKRSNRVESSDAFVDIDGAVSNPGVYRLTTEQRIADAIDAAGGLADDADVSTVNRASKVIDGQKIHIPRAGEAVIPSDDGGGVSSADSTSSAGSVSSLVNINTANATELESLPGVGPSTAQSIIDDRTQNGPFASTDDLMRVSGIGEKKFEKLKGKICI